MHDGREAYERSIDRYNAGDMDDYAHAFTEDAVLVTPNGAVEGRASIRAYWARQRVAFPDCTLAIETLMDQDDMVASEWTWTGTNTGLLTLRDGTEMTPTGRRIALRGMELARLRDGMISVYHVCWDGIAVLGQLGLLPEARSA